MMGRGVCQTYTFKLGVPGQDKVTLLMEAPARFHTTRSGRL